MNWSMISIDSVAKSWYILFLSAIKTHQSLGTVVYFYQGCPNFFPCRAKTEGHGPKDTPIVLDCIDKMQNGTRIPSTFNWPTSRLPMLRKIVTFILHFFFHYKHMVGEPPPACGHPIWEALIWSQCHIHHPAAILITAPNLQIHYSLLFGQHLLKSTVPSVRGNCWALFYF